MEAGLRERGVAEVAAEDAIATVGLVHVGGDARARRRCVDAVWAPVHNLTALTAFASHYRLASPRRCSTLAASCACEGVGGRNVVVGDDAALRPRGAGG